jgi:hypothetical protein
VSVAAKILRTYRAPDAVIHEWLALPRHEGRALAMLMAGCAIVAISTLPHLLAQPGEAPTEARISAVLFAWLAVAPLAFYVIAFALCLVGRAFRLTADGYATRLALFWSVLAATPLWLLNGVGMSVPQENVTFICGFIALAGFLILTGAHLRAANRAI